MMSSSADRLAAAPSPGDAAGAEQAIETRGLTKQFRRVTALSDCSVTVPPGRISALAGLARPTRGTAAVLGGAPRQDPAFLAEIGYLAQEVPLYRRLTAQDHITA